mgnify:CR=1 FL=1
MLAEVMTQAIELAEQASDNLEGCKELVAMVWSCDESLAQVPDREERLRHCEKELQRLEGALREVCEFVQRFGSAHTAVRVLFASSDGERFASLRQALHESMTVSSGRQHACRP